MSKAVKPKCCGQVWPAGAWRSYTCGNNASMEHEGKHYCKTHHPPTVQAKRDASHAKFQAQFDAQRVREQAERDAAAEQKRRADAYDQLVERVKELEGALKQISEIEDQMYGADWEEIEEAREIANAALAKALPNAAAKEAGK